MQLNFINGITIISIFQAIFLAMVFFFKKAEGNRIYNKIFAAIIFIFSIQIMVSLSVNYWSYVYFKGYYKFFFVLYQTAYLFGPLLYFYIQSITNQSYSFRVGELIHFLPFAIAITLMLVLIYGFEIVPGGNYTRLGVIIHSMIYIFISIHYLKNRGISLKSLFDLKNPHDFIKFLLVCYIMLWLVNVQIFAIIKFITFAKWCAYVSSLYSLTAFVFINSIAFLALIKPDLFIHKQKYANSSLAVNEKDILFNKLIEFVTTSKPYLEPSLTLKKLSDDLDMPLKSISQLINEKQNQNFNDFINTFRIEESKRYMQDISCANLTIQEIFYKSGFNSKSTFNLIFKKQTGYTPLEYRRQFLPE